MNVTKTLLAGLALAASTVGANAATYYANNVVSVTPGLCTGTVSGCASNDRQNVANAVDTDDNTFYALGFGGEIVVSFAQALINASAVGQNISAFEITFNRSSGHNEAADVYSVLDGVSTFVGTINNLATGGTVRASSDFDSIRLVDVSLRDFPDTTSFDGFDLSAVKISPVPLPAAGVMLLAGLGGLAALRRRKNAA